MSAVHQELCVVGKGMNLLTCPFHQELKLGCV